MVAFDHREPGTSERVWEEDAENRRTPALEPRFDDLVVVAAHPDDETLGAAGLMRRVHDAGGRVTVIVASDGEGSHPGSPTMSPRELASLRRDEVASAVRALAPGARLHFLGLPDGGLREHADALAGRLGEILDALTTARALSARTLLVAPWSGDGHRDHRVAGEVVAGLARDRGIRMLGYPVWLWHWGTPDDVPWNRARVLALSDDDSAAKRRAVAFHVSQLRPLSGATGDETVIHDGMRQHFDRDREIFFEEVDGGSSMPGEWFDAFYARNEDPWGFETRWYERRKRDILMSSFPASSLGEVLEIGCSTGLVTQRLAARADHIVAVDPVRSALDAARARLPDDARVTFVHGQVPRDWPKGRFDTVVLSEVGYYLSRADLASVIELAMDSLREDGCLVACHWRHHVTDYPQTGDDVHAALRAVPGWEALVRHEEADFLLEVYVRIPSISVAAREGLV